MAIYLDDTQDEHKLLIKLLEESTIPVWIKKSLIGRIQDDINFKEEQKNCEHKFHEYTGNKSMCKCGATTNITWTITSLLEEGGAETHHSQEIGNTAQRSETTPNEV